MTKLPLLQIGTVTERMASRFAADWDVTRLFEIEEADRPSFLSANGARFIGVATDGHWGVPADVLNALPNLEVVASYGVGYDAIDAHLAATRGIKVSHTPNVLNDEVADTAILLWLAVFRQLVAADKWARSGNWQVQGSFPLTRSVRGTTMGILGLGRIGMTIADRAGAFGAKVIYHSRSNKGVDYPYFADLTEMAASCDALMVITPGGAETRHLVNKHVLDALGPNGVLVNISRGSVVDETALIAALETGRLGGAGLDVFEAEPKIPDSLTAMDNVVLTPHVGSATHETRQAMGDLVCDNLSRYLADGQLVTPVPECAHL